MPADELIGLVGDIGGTNARFAIATVRNERPTLSDSLSLPGHAYRGLEDAARDYLTRTEQKRLDAVVFACAGPVVDGSVAFTNVAWRASEAGLAAALGVPRVHLINDLAAVACATPAEVSLARQNGDAMASRAVEAFCAIMGSIAGDVALTFGARGGVFLAGGVAATVLTEAQDTVFRSRFEDKGRFHTYLADIPTMLINDTNAALLGAARAMHAYAEAGAAA